MPDLRLVAVSEDGTHLVLRAEDGKKYTLPIDERLRAAVRGDRARMSQIELESDSALRPRDIQARIRAGATAEEVALAAGIPVERVKRFEGPVLAERAYMAERAQKTPVRRQGESNGPCSVTWSRSDCGGTASIPRPSAGTPGAGTTAVGRCCSSTSWTGSGAAPAGRSTRRAAW